MNPIKLLTALLFVLAFAGCEIVVTDDLSTYETRSYSTANLYDTQLCSLYNYEGDSRDVNSCGSWSYLGSSNYVYFSFSPSSVLENGYDRYSVYSVYAFSYDGDTYIYYDIGSGRGFEYNYTRDEVGYYDGRGHADFYK